MGERAALAKLQAKLCAAITAAHAEVLRVAEKYPTVTQWLDRDIAVTLADIDLAAIGNSAKELRNITAQLTAQFDLLPVLVTSRSEHRRVTVEERFGWKTKRDIRLELLRKTLAELEAGLEAELEREQREREVRATRVFMDAFVAAKDTDKIKDLKLRPRRKSVSSCSWHASLTLHRLAQNGERDSGV